MMRERLLRSFREDTLSASLAVVLLLFGGLPLYGAATADQDAFAWRLLLYGVANTAVALSVLIGPRSFAGAVACTWGLLQIFAVGLFYFWGLVFVPLAFPWMLIAARWNDSMRPAVAAFSFLIGATAWGVVWAAALM